MNARKRIAVAGATGRVGRHVVDVLREAGHEPVPMSRSQGVDIATGEGLADALAGVESVIDAASNRTPDPQAATEYFLAAAHNLQTEGTKAGVQHMVVVSIVNADRITDGFIGSKIPHEEAMKAGPIPTQTLRATQFHEFVGDLVAWSTQGDVAYLPRMRTQLVAARTVAEVLVDLAVGGPVPDAPVLEIAGPREERLADAARLLVERRGDPVRIEEVSDPGDPEHVVYASGALLPGPGAVIAGPSFAEWLAEQPVRAAA